MLLSLHPSIPPSLPFHHTRRYSQLALTFLNYSLAALLSLPLLLLAFLLPYPSSSSSSPSSLLRQRLACFLLLLLLLLFLLPPFLLPVLPRLLLNHLLYSDVHLPWLCVVTFPCLVLLGVVGWEGGREGEEGGKARAKVPKLEKTIVCTKKKEQTY